MDFDVRIDEITYFNTGARDVRIYLAELLRRHAQHVSIKEVTSRSPEPVSMGTITPEGERHEWQVIDGWYLRVGKHHLGVPLFRECSVKNESRSIQIILLVCDLMIPTYEFVSGTVIVATATVEEWTPERVNEVFSGVRWQW